MAGYKINSNLRKVYNKIILAHKVEKNAGFEFSPDVALIKCYTAIYGF